MKSTEKITISAFSEDYSEKSYKFYFANKQFEFVPKSQVTFLENSKGGEEFGEGIESRYFEIPTWLFSKLRGAEYYGV
jgi:hypothetical protein